MKIIHTLPFIPKGEKYQYWKDYWKDAYATDSNGKVLDCRSCAPSDYMENDFDYEDTVLFAQMLFPTFIVRDGGVFVGFLYSDEKFDTLSRDYPIHKVEEFMNYVWFEYLFHGKTNLDMELSDELAEMMAFSWRLCLKEKFPDKKFIVNLFKGQYYSPKLTFFQAESLAYKSEYMF